MNSAAARRWGLVLGVWGAVATFSAAQIWVARAALGEPPGLWPLVRLEYPIWLFWVAATVGIVRLSRHYPLDRSRMTASVGVHLGSAIATAVGFVAFGLLWYQAFNPYPYLDPSVSTWFWRAFRDRFIDGFVLYWAIVGVYHAFSNYTRFRQRDHDAERIRAQLAEATVAMLRGQLRPHFLFNALNTASALIDSDPKLARRVIGRLGELLHASFRQDSEATVSLGDEFELVRAYLELEQSRFGDRLAVEIGIDPGLAGIQVPTFLLQPIVENAVRHGLAPKPGGGHLAVRARRVDNRLELQVEDDGLGLPTGPWSEGVGVGNTRRRLAELYGQAAGIDLRRRRSGGLDVRLRIPIVAAAAG